MDELSEALGESLREMIERGFEPPLWVAVISINGCTLTFRYDADADPSTGGLSPTLLTSHASEALRLPINVMFVDSRGEAALVLLDTKGYQLVN